MEKSIKDLLKKINLTAELSAPRVRRYLAFCKTTEEGMTHPYVVTRESLGFPDKKLAKEKIIRLLSKNQIFLFAYENYLEGEEAQLVEEIVQHFYNNFGPYFDNIQGTRNLFLNLPELLESEFISEITGSSRAYIIGAGPSLEIVLPQLKRVYEEKHGLIFACDAVLKRLLKEGIRPDLVVSTERVDECVSFFEGLSEEELKAIPCLFNAISNPATLKAFKGKKYFYLRKIDEYKWVGVSEAEIDTTPFVSQTMTQLAVKMGMKQIVFVAQDFAYGPAGESHANLLNPNDVFNQKVLPEGTFDVVGVQKGSLVKTSRVLNQFALDLEIVVEKNPKLTFFNTSPIGRKIKGCRLKNLGSIGWTERPETKIRTKQFPLNIDHVLMEAARAWHEFEKKEKLHPMELGAHHHIGHLGYHFLIQPYVVWQSMSFSEPWREEEFASFFQNTYAQVRRDLMEILIAFISENYTLKRLEKEGILNVQNFNQS